MPNPACIAPLDTGSDTDKSLPMAGPRRAWRNRGLRDTPHKTQSLSPPLPCSGLRFGKQGFTLIECLVVIAILGLVVSILVPVVGTSLDRAEATQCKSNLRTMAHAVSLYTLEHEGTFPPAYVSVDRAMKRWDFSFDATGTLTPGLIWESYGVNEILNCPTYEGSANWFGDEYTGYNYNSSYLGGVRIVNGGKVNMDVPSANMLQVNNPAKTALFGDGEYENGANKFMRAPHPGPLDPTFNGRTGGTQGFRHRGKTHVVFVDGHVEAMEIGPQPPGVHLAPGIGFLSPDNSLYDLE